MRKDKKRGKTEREAKGRVVLMETRSDREMGRREGGKKNE